MNKTIFTSFFTTTNFDRIKKILQYFFTLNKKNYVKELEQKILRYLNVENSQIISFYNWRSALFHALNVLKLKDWDEVLLQAYTCISVANSIINAWLKPIYVDVDQSLNMDLSDLKNKITQKTKVIIVQHTFWNPANINWIKKICKEKNIVIIEDVAHSIWTDIDWKKLWTFWDFAIFSFWRDKVLSTVNWGFLIINNSVYFDFVEKIKKKLTDISFYMLFQNVSYIFVSFFAYKLYDFFSIWKALILSFKKLKIIPLILSKQEKLCQYKNFFYKYPNILAYVWIWEFEKIDIYNYSRKKIAEIYNTELKKYEKQKHTKWSIYLRYVLFVDNIDNFTKKCKSKKILLWNWYQQVIAPENIDYKQAMYLKWSCPNAEKFASKTINLPCFPDLHIKYVLYVISILKKINKT